LPHVIIADRRIICFAARFDAASREKNLRSAVLFACLPFV